MAKQQITMDDVNKVFFYQDKFGDTISQDEIARLVGISPASVSKALMGELPCQRDRAESATVMQGKGPNGVNVCMTNNAMHIIECIENENDLTRSLIKTVSDDTTMENIYEAIAETNRLVAVLANVLVTASQNNGRFNADMADGFREKISACTIEG